MEIKDSKKYQEYIKMRNQVKGLAQKGYGKYGEGDSKKCEQKSVVHICL
jgi:hypothetical protein